MVWARITNIRHDRDQPARHRSGSKNTKNTEEEVGRQHQRGDRPGLLTDTKFGRRQEDVETADFKVIGGAPTTLQVPR